MKIKHNNLIIEEGNPFGNCKLNREKYAVILTEIVETYKDGFVLAVNNEWGTGKTTFIKMWQAYLGKKEFQTIHFNAWENDFETNPLVAIMAEFNKLSKKRKIEFNFKSLNKHAALITKHMAPAIFRALADKYINVDEISKGIENFTKGATEVLENQIVEYTERKESIEDFKEKISDFVKQLNNKKPLIFFIDELDRCRPSYAVEVLEQIKHLFSVEGIVFVLSIDKVHLASSIKGFYGSESINTDEYLRRFIDLEYSIPKPDIDLFNQYLYEYYGFKQLYESIKVDEDEYGRELLSIYKTLYSKNKITLRQAEKIFSNTKIATMSIKGIERSQMLVFYILNFIKIIKHDLFRKIENKEISNQELSHEFSTLFDTSSEEINNYGIGYIELALLFFYDNFVNGLREPRENDSLFNYSDGEGPVLTLKIKSSFINEEENLINTINTIYNYFNRRKANLEFLLNKVNLLESISS